LIHRLRINTLEHEFRSRQHEPYRLAKKKARHLAKPIFTRSPEEQKLNINFLEEVEQMIFRLLFVQCTKKNGSYYEKSIYANSIMEFSLVPLIDKVMRDNSHSFSNNTYFFLIRFSGGIVMLFKGLSLSVVSSSDIFWCRCKKSIPFSVVL
jgi:hypothetical protein